jgi:hypothetical protein
MRIACGSTCPCTSTCSSAPQEASVLLARGYAKLPRGCGLETGPGRRDQDQIPRPPRSGREGYGEMPNQVLTNAPERHVTPHSVRHHPPLHDMATYRSLSAMGESLKGYAERGTLTVIPASGDKSRVVLSATQTSRRKPSLRCRGCSRYPRPQ